MAYISTDLQTVNAIHRGLSQHLKGDYLPAATALRLPSSLNTKHDPTMHCEVLESDWSRRYSLADFAVFQHFHHVPVRGSAPINACPNSKHTRLIPDQIQRIADTLFAQNFKRRGDWLNGLCPYPENHRHGDRHPSFGFNTETGYGYCFVCGQIQMTLH